MGLPSLKSALWTLAIALLAIYASHKFGFIQKITG